MKEIAYIILCCFSTGEGEMYRYEVSREDNPKQTGILGSFVKYQEGDTALIPESIAPSKIKN
jgi:hypothetical protein